MWIRDEEKKIDETQIIALEGETVNRDEVWRV